jgi:hypothetical protein
VRRTRPYYWFISALAAARSAVACAVMLCNICCLVTLASAGWDDVRLDRDAHWLENRIDEPGGVIALSSPIFRLAIDQYRGGEVTRLELFDGVTWRPVLGDDGLTFPAFTLRLEGVQEPLLPGEVQLRRHEVSGKRADLVYVMQLHTADGEPSGLQLSYHYEIFPEGAMFLRLGLTGWPISPITEASVALELDHSAVQAVRFRDEQLAKPTPALPSARIAIGWEPRRSYTNELELQIESKRGVSGDVMYESSPGHYTWQLAHADESADVVPSVAEDVKPHDVRKAPVLYYNRIALGMTNSPYATSRTTCIGERIYHWVNFLDLSPDRWHPTDDELAEMAENGATMVILHHEYMDQRGSNGDPPADYTILRDDEELLRCIQTAERLGLRVGIYLRGVEPYALNDARIRLLIDLGVDGFYIDWHGAHAIAFHEGRNQPAATLGDRHYSNDGKIAPAREYFRYVHQLRELVGPEGFIIGHLGSFNSGILANVGLDGFVAGETASEWVLFDSREDAVYCGMMAGAVVMPWPEEAASFSDPQTLARMAAWGFYPHILMGIDKSKTGLFPRDPSSQHYQIISPYWRLLSTLENRRDTQVLNLPADAGVVATADDEDVRVVVYREPSGELLVLVANLSMDMIDTTVRLDNRIMPTGTCAWSLIGPGDERPEPIETGPDNCSAKVSLKPGGLLGLLIQPVQNDISSISPASSAKEVP